MVAGLNRRREGAGWARVGCWLVSLAAGCGQLIGIPSDPELVEPTTLGSGAARALPDELAELDESAPALGSVPSEASAGGARSGDTEVASVSEEGEPGELVAPAATQASTGPAPGGEQRPDAGAPAPPDAGLLPPSTCAPQVDVVMLVDNSGSMAAEARAFEAGLPAFVERLVRGGVDHRVILISRHRQDDADASEEASTSVCIEAPVSGLEVCPGEEPALSERFFQYSVKIDASDSFERLLESLEEADRFELAPRGWAEWLRPGAQPVFVEISDADSDMPVDELLAGLAAASPELVPASGAPAFVFHSIVGLLEKGDGVDRYGPEEPLEPRVCSGAGSGADNAGERYQELSRLTGGLRLPICPAAALEERLLTLAADIASRGACD